MGQGNGMMQGNSPGNFMISSLYQNYQASFNQALFLAALAAGIIAIVVSLLLSRSVVAPVRSLMTASRRIAEGDYGERVQGSASDEVGQLAGSFNLMAEKLEQVETMRRQLIGDVSHELRTPLTSIKGSMEGLIDGVLPATAETFQQIHQEADRMGRLVDDLQELSRVEAHAYPLDIRPVLLPELVPTIMKRLSSQAQAKHIDLRFEIPSDLPPALADTDRITQVLTNLVSNAIQYTQEGGKVTVSAVSHPGEILVAVADDGIGIPAEHLDHLFTRFYRVDKSRSRQSGGGSGIGLTIAKYIIEAHGGRIWAESEGAGKGSTFTFSLKSA
jgi:two-component system sensor histidine kinase BaeS